jgi:hypothetical protein
MAARMSESCSDRRKLRLSIAAKITIDVITATGTPMRVGHAVRCHGTPLSG